MLFFLSPSLFDIRDWNEKRGWFCLKLFKIIDKQILVIFKM